MALPTIRPFGAGDLEDMLILLEKEGSDWADYWHLDNRAKLAQALETSIVYLLFADAELCGYLRARDDSGYGIYVYDLLVAREHRGNSYGQKLLEALRNLYPDQPIYIMSDADGYYDKIGQERIGSVFQLS